jgi:protein-tyrosine kinase
LVERFHRSLGLAAPHRAVVSGLAPLEVAAAGAPGEASRAKLVTVDRAALRERRLILGDDIDPAAHAYRMLRTQVLRQARLHKLKLIGVVSAADGEGKTLTAVNLALSVAAEPNQTALLLDLDLRKPSMAKLLGLEGANGIECWFDGSADLSDLFVRLEGIERLRILPATRAVAGSSELLAAARTHEVLIEIRNRYSDRLVIVDLPPVLLADDFLTVVSQLDAVLVVVSEGRTRREDVNRMKEFLGGVRVLGTVLNGSSESEKRAY